MASEIKTVYELLRANKEKLDLQLDDLSMNLADAQSKAPVDLGLGKNLQQVEEAEFVPIEKKEETKERGTTEQSAKRPGIWSKDYLKYPVIFVTSFVFFYLILNYGAFFARVTTLFQKNDEPAPIESSEGQVLGANTSEFQAWISHYFFSVNNPDKITPNVDYDKDGLSNYQEYLLGLNPVKKDTDNDGYNDGQEVLNGYNPSYDGLLTEKQKAIIGGENFDSNQNTENSQEDRPENPTSDAWDLRQINNRIAYYSVTDLAAGPIKPSNQPAINYDLSKRGEINIPKLGVKAPVIWTNNPDDFENDLDNGLVHYPGTSFPGQSGIAYISGHSSNYIWRQSAYSYVFTRLNELETGDEFFVTVYESDGNPVNLRYVVFAENRYKPDDQAQFASSDPESVVNLSTCWPIGSTAERYVVSGRLTGI